MAEHISLHPVGESLRVIADEKPADATSLIFEDGSTPDLNDVKDKRDRKKNFLKNWCAVRADF